MHDISSICISYSHSCHSSCSGRSERTIPITVFSSSIVPLASILISSFSTPSPPKIQVVPLSPVRVYILLIIPKVSLSSFHPNRGVYSLQSDSYIDKAEWKQDFLLHLSPPQWMEVLFQWKSNETHVLSIPALLSGGFDNQAFNSYFP